MPSATTSPPEAYTCWLQHGAASDMDVAVRTISDPRPMKAIVQRAVRARDDRVEIYNLYTLEEAIARFTWSWSRQFNTFFLGGFAAVGFLLASVGVYGVTAYSVSQRTHEIGIRMALGARPRDVGQSVVREALALAGAGLAVGLPLALMLAQGLRHFLYGIQPHDPTTLIGGLFLITGVAVLAGWIPARRAMKVDPVVALRDE